MSQGLGKVAAEPLAANVVLFGEQTKVIADRKYAFEKLFGLRLPALHGPAIRQPERTREESTFFRGRGARLPQNKAIFHQVLLDSLNGAGNPLVFDGQEPGCGDQQ